MRNELTSNPWRPHVDSIAHWQQVYETKRPDAVSWYQPSAARSLALIRRFIPDSSAPVIDVGAGASVLVGELLDAGYSDLTVLDIAAGALAISQARLGEHAGRVQWIEHDVRTAPLPTVHYAGWHDRAVFHFLTEAEDRAAYVAQLERCVRVGGHVLIATFAEDGPTKCSGLPVVRYSPEMLRAELGEDFHLVETERELHPTPMGTSQSFLYCVFRKT